MKISIITATYNSAANIAACLASVNNQTYKNIEHIIVDGASRGQRTEACLHVEILLRNFTGQAMKCDVRSRFHRGQRTEMRDQTSDFRHPTSDF